MIGTYKFYENGELICAQKNLLTTLGKNAILRYMAGYTGHFGRSIRLGAGNTAAAVGDTALNFESAAAPVTLITADYINTALVFKARLDPNFSGVIYEAGLSTNVSDTSTPYGSMMLLNFEQYAENWTLGSWNTSGARMGAANLRLAPAVSATITSVLADMYMDFSGYSTSDDFKLAYNVGNAFTASMFIRFYTDASNYYTYTITAPTAGYKITSFNKSNFVATGTPSWSNIIQTAVSVTSTAGGAAQVDFDGFRVDDKDTYQEVETLVSRSVLGTPVTTTVGVPLDIEYTLDLTL